MGFRINEIKSWAKESMGAVRKKITLMNGKESDEFEYLNALADILYLSIRKKDEKIARTIESYLDQKFFEYREANKSEPKPYPDVYYQIAYKAAEELAVLKTKRFGFLESATFGGDWLIGYKSDFHIQSSTYASLWSILLLALEYDRDDLFMRFWRNASQFAMLNLRSDPMRSPFEDEASNDTHNKANTREKNREQFFEFVHALGGLLLYKKRYSLIKQIFSFSNSHPPKYELLPERMDQVFEIYYNFIAPDAKTATTIAAKYNFPGLEGVSNESVVRNWICKYAALLFLRQYTLGRYLITDKPLEIPDLPISQSEKRLWMNHLQWFLTLVKQLRNDNDLMQILGYSHITDEWCKENKMDPPKQFIEEFKSSLESEYQSEYYKQPISKTKRNNFYKKSAEFLNEAFDKCSSVNVSTHLNSYKIEANQKYNIYTIDDYMYKLERVLFLDNNDRSHGNYDSITAEIQADRITTTAADTFAINKSKTFLLNNKDLFPAIEKIKGDLKPDKLIIVNTGVYLKFLISRLKIQGLTEDKYKDIQIVKFRSPSRIAGRSLYFLKKEDLPYLKFNEPEQELINKYDLRQIGKKEYNIYAGLVDCKEQAESSGGNNAEKDPTKLEVLTYIATRMEIKWKKTVRMFELKQYTSLEERGLTNSLKDINVTFS